MEELMKIWETGRVV